MAPPIDSVSIAILSGEAMPEVKLDHMQKVKLNLEDVGDERYLLRKVGQIILIAGNTDTALTNGIYDLRRAIMEDKIPNPFEHDWNVKTFPRFKHRIIYHFMTPWDLRKISVDTFTSKEWKIHLDYIRSLNYSQVVIDFWSNQYYHPDYETTYHAKPRYDIIKNAFKYAHDIGLRTGVVLFPCMVPASVYYDNPSMRARNAEGPWGYKGCHLCWNKGKELAVKFDRYLLEHFNGEVDTLFIEPNDPGICGCKECMKNYVQIVKEIIEVYEKLARKYTADRWIGFISWWFSEVERAVGGNICREVFSSLPKGTLVVDGVRSTLNIAKECGHETAFFFMLDPEGGWEDRALITRPELRLIDAQIKKSLEAGDVGIMNYRLTPFCQFIADYVFGRKCWDASLFDKNIITELSAEICRTNEGREKFTEAVLALEKWWMDKDVRDLRRANKLFNELKYVEKEGDDREN